MHTGHGLNFMRIATRQDVKQALKFLGSSFNTLLTYIRIVLPVVREQRLNFFFIARHVKTAARPHASVYTRMKELFSNYCRFRLDQ